MAINENRRQEQRLPIVGLALKIRKSGIGGVWLDFEQCRTVDLSLNGLAFTTENLDFKVPEKIDFALFVDEHEVKGSGIVCNRRVTEDGLQFGLMFLSVSPEIGSFIENGESNKQELKHSAEAVAERLAYSLWSAQGRNGQWEHRKMQELFDVLRCYLNRLGEMGVRQTAETGDRYVLPIQGVKIYRNESESLVLKWRHRAEEDMRFAIQLRHNHFPIDFLVNNETVCKNSLQVAEKLGEQLKPSLSIV